MKTFYNSFFSLILLVVMAGCSKSDLSPAGVNHPEKTSALHQAGCHQYFYYYNGQPRNLGSALSDEIIIGFKKGTNLNIISKVLDAYPELQSLQYSQETPGGDIMVFSLADQVTCRRVDSLLQVLPAHSHIDFAGPFLPYPDYPGAKLGIANAIVVSLAPGVTEAQLAALQAETKTQVVEDLGYGTYILKLTRQSPMGCLETANYLYEKGLFETSEPDFIMVLPPLM